MKLKNLTHTILAAILSAAALSNVRAVDQILTFNITTYHQSPLIIDGTNGTEAPPEVKMLRTADILQSLAQDEFAAGNWPSNSFPATAKIVMGNLVAAGLWDFHIIAGTNFLVSVTNIMTFQSGNCYINSGKSKGGLASPIEKTLRMGRFNYDSTAISNGTRLQFFIQGLITDVWTDTTPNIQGAYVETYTSRMINGAGEGVDHSINYNNRFVLTGTVIATARYTGIY
jgi:hypothetical protein